MVKYPVLKYALSPEQVMDHIAYLADLAILGSMAAVARERGTTVEAVYYHLHILNKEVGLVYQTHRGRKAKVTELGYEVLSVFQPANEEKMKCVSHIEGMMGTKLHAQCPRRFPNYAKVFCGVDLYPEVKNMKRKLVIACLTCGTKVMVLVRSCVKKWIDLHADDIIGPSPLFKLQYLSDLPALIRS